MAWHKTLALIGDIAWCCLSISPSDSLSFQFVKGKVHSLQYFYWFRYDTICSLHICPLFCHRTSGYGNIRYFFMGLFLEHNFLVAAIGDSVCGVWICWWRIGAQATCHPYSYCCKAPVQSSRQHNPKGYIRITCHSIHVELKHEFEAILAGYYVSKWTPATSNCVGSSMIRLWPMKTSVQTDVLGRLVHLLELKSTVAMLWRLSNFKTIRQFIT